MWRDKREFAVIALAYAGLDAQSVKVAKASTTSQLIWLLCEAHMDSLKEWLKYDDAIGAHDDNDEHCCEMAARFVLAQDACKDAIHEAMSGTPLTELRKVS